MRCPNMSAETVVKLVATAHRYDAEGMLDHFLHYSHILEKHPDLPSVLIDVSNHNFSTRVTEPALKDLATTLQSESMTFKKWAALRKHRFQKGQAPGTGSTAVLAALSNGKETQGGNEVAQTQFCVLVSEDLTKREVITGAVQS